MSAQLSIGSSRIVLTNPEFLIISAAGVDPSCLTLGSQKSPSYHLRVLSQDIPTKNSTIAGEAQLRVNANHLALTLQPLPSPAPQKATKKP